MSRATLVYEHPEGSLHTLKSSINLCEPTFLSFQALPEPPIICSQPLLGSMGFRYNPHHRCVCHNRLIEPLGEMICGVMTLEWDEEIMGASNLAATWTSVFKMADGARRSRTEILRLSDDYLAIPSNVNDESNVGPMAAMVVRIALENELLIASSIRVAAAKWKKETESPRERETMAAGWNWNDISQMANGMHGVAAQLSACIAMEKFSTGHAEALIDMTLLKTKQVLLEEAITRIAVDINQWMFIREYNTPLEGCKRLYLLYGRQGVLFRAAEEVKQLIFDPTSKIPPDRSSSLLSKAWVKWAVHDRQEPKKYRNETHKQPHHNTASQTAVQGKM